MPNPVRRTCDKTVVTLMVLLLLMGLVTLFSATYYQKAATGDALAAVKKQLIGVVLGAVLYRLIIAVAISTKIVPTEGFKLVSALIVAVFLAIPYWKGHIHTKKGGSVHA